MSLTLGPLERAVLKTLAYADLFDYPLTLAQLHDRLIGYKTPLGSIEDALAEGEPLRELVATRDGFWFLSGREGLVATRREREAKSEAYLQRFVPALRGMCKLPYVEAVAISGSLAHFNMGDKVDLDLFVIFEGGRLWSGLASTWLYRRIRSLDDFCLNYAVDAEQLRLPQHSLFDAHQLISLLPMMNLPGIRALWAANEGWIQEWFPNWRPDTTVEGMEHYLSGRFDGRLALIRREAVCSHQGLPLLREEDRLRTLWTRIEEPLEGRIRARWFARHGKQEGEQGHELYGPHIFKRHENSHRSAVEDRFRARLAELGQPLQDGELGG